MFASGEVQLRLLGLRVGLLRLPDLLRLAGEEAVQRLREDRPGGLLAVTV